MWRGYTLHHHLAFNAAAAKTHVLMSPSLLSSAGANVSQEKKTNWLFQAWALRIGALGGGSPGMQKMWVYFLLLQRFGSSVAVCK